MTDRTDHRDEAERMLAEAHAWAAVAGEPTPESNELAYIGYAAVNALLAIHDALTAADRYAANEAKQREAAGSDPLDEDDHRDAAHEHEWDYDEGAVCLCGDNHGYCECGAVEQCPPDPLDEDDHRDRLTGSGYRLRRRAVGCWHIRLTGHGHPACDTTLDYWADQDGPLTFAPEAAQEATGGDLSAPEGESGDEVGGDADDAPEQLLCPECGHDIDDHNGDPDAPATWCAGCDDCRLTPSAIARALIEQEGDGRD